ncbi:MAG: hypothetical protein WCO84_08730, partial [bacterium]
LSAPSITGKFGGQYRRGIVQKFSHRSRSRLFQSLRKLELKALPHFVTLTYPDHYPTDERVWKRDLDVFLKRIRRKFSKASGFWKMELKERQSGEQAGTVAPHFHLLIWGLPAAWSEEGGKQTHWEFELQSQKMAMNGKRFLRREVWRGGELKQLEHQGGDAGLDDASDCGRVERIVSKRVQKGVAVNVVEYWASDGVAHLDLRLRSMESAGLLCGVGEVLLEEWISLTWASVVKSDDPRHVRAGTNCEVVRTAEGVLSYAAKYIGKADSAAAGPVGRYWGIFNRTQLPWGELVSIEVTGEIAYRIRRIAAHYINKNRRRRPLRLASGRGLSVFCTADQWARLLPDKLGGGGRVLAPFLP